MIIAIKIVYRHRLLAGYLMTLPLWLQAGSAQAQEMDAAVPLFPEIVNNNLQFVETVVLSDPGSGRRPRDLVFCPLHHVPAESDTGPTCQQPYAEVILRNLTLAEVLSMRVFLGDKEHSIYAFTPGDTFPRPPVSIDIPLTWFEPIIQNAIQDAVNPDAFDGDLTLTIQIPGYIPASINNTDFLWLSIGTGDINVRRGYRPILPRQPEISEITPGDGCISDLPCESSDRLLPDTCNVTVTFNPLEHHDSYIAYQYSLLIYDDRQEQPRDRLVLPLGTGGNGLMVTPVPGNTAMPAVTARKAC